MQGKKFISPGAWFSMNYPSDWNEFEDGEGSFLFYNPDVWTGNFRISAFKGNATYGRDAVRQELKENESASLVKVGALDSAYSKEMFQEEGNTILLTCGLPVSAISLSNVRLLFPKAEV